MKKLILAVFVVSFTFTTKGYSASNGDEDERSTVATETCASESPLVLSLEKPYDAFAPDQRLSLASSKSSRSYSVEEDDQSGFCIEYLGLDGEDSFGIGLDLAVYYVNLGFDIYQYDTSGNIKKNEGWDLHLGGHKRFWWNIFFLEGNLGLAYCHATYQIKGGDKEKNGDFGLYLNPRVGIKLFNTGSLGLGSLGITASYRWIFEKFKFKDEYTCDYFTIGLCFTDF